MSDDIRVPRDFDKLRAERNARHAAFIEQMRAEGYEPVGGCTLHDPDACYCACPQGPCEHKWNGKPYESEDGCTWSTTCSRCGTVSLTHDMRVMP